MKRRVSLRRSISTQKKHVQPKSPTSRLPILDPKLAPQIPDKLRKKWIRNPDMGLVHLNEEHRPKVGTKIGLPMITGKSEKSDEPETQIGPDEDTSKILQSPETSATPQMRKLSISNTNMENWLLDDESNINSELDLSLEENKKLKRNSSGRKRVLATELNLEVGQPILRLSSVPNILIMNASLSPNYIEPAIFETMAHLIDLVISNELKEKRNENRENKKKQYKGRREVIRYNPITPKLTRSGRKYGRTSFLNRNWEKIFRKSIESRQSVAPIELNDDRKGSHHLANLMKSDVDIIQFQEISEDKIPDPLAEPALMHSNLVLQTIEKVADHIILPEVEIQIHEKENSVIERAEEIRTPSDEALDSNLVALSLPSPQKHDRKSFITNPKKNNRQLRVLNEEDYHPSLKLPPPAKSILKKEDQPGTSKKLRNEVNWADEKGKAPLHSERKISEVPNDYRFRKSTYRSSNFYPDPY